MPRNPQITTGAIFIHSVHVRSVTVAIRRSRRIVPKGVSDTATVVVPEIAPAVDTKLVFSPRVVTRIARIRPILRTIAFPNAPQLLGNAERSARTIAFPLSVDAWVVDMWNIGRIDT